MNKTKIDWVIEILKNSADCAEQNKNNYSAYGGFPEQAEEEIEALNIAIAALERQKKPCEYCADLGRYKSFAVELFHQVAADDIYDISVDVNYCPNCGRDLRESEG